MKKIKRSKIRILVSIFAFLIALPVFAHCDSYDGPVIQDAYKALEKEDVTYVLKWIDADQEAEIKNLFSKTVNLKNTDAQVYAIVEKHFLETLVRLHRETEGAAFTGLKPAGSTTPIVQMADKSIETKEVNTLLSNIGNHIKHVIQEKFDKVAALHKVKDNSVAEGRAYVMAYVDYTHTLEAIEHILAHGGHH
ncbi:MAG: hypothetical protein GX163_07735 [Bacteroidetes bacterium]|jgi:replicative DNA helicase|nr:hypothetical protein [Bacteroidota bacterium]